MCVCGGGGDRDRPVDRKKIRDIDRRRETEGAKRKRESVNK